MQKKGLSVSGDGFIIIYKGKESEKESTHTHITESLCCPPETKATLKTNYTSIKKNSARTSG